MRYIRYFPIALLDFARFGGGLDMIGGVGVGFFIGPRKKSPLDCRLESITTTSDNMHYVLVISTITYGYQLL